MGDAWIKSGRPAALRVPSVIVPGEFNYLLNPRHPDFSNLKFGEPAAFLFDPRLSRHE